MIMFSYSWHLKFYVFLVLDLGIRVGVDEVNVMVRHDSASDGYFVPDKEFLFGRVAP
jgi:hypothetical protein